MLSPPALSGSASRSRRHRYRIAREPEARIAGVSTELTYESGHRLPFMPSVSEAPDDPDEQNGCPRDN